MYLISTVFQKVISRKKPLVSRKQPLISRKFPESCGPATRSFSETHFKKGGRHHLPPARHQSFPERCCHSLAPHLFPERRQSFPERRHSLAPLVSRKQPPLISRKLPESSHSFPESFQKAATYSPAESEGRWHGLPPAPCAKRGSAAACLQPGASHPQRGGCCSLLPKLAPRKQPLASESF